MCAGRGSAKSTLLYKIALNETLFGDFVIPPGERHAAMLTSRLKDEASKAIGILSHYLRLLGVRHQPTDGLITLDDLPRDIRVTASSVAGNTGWRCYFNGADEVAKWASEGAQAVDAAEVLASKAAMTATHPNARHVIVGSPFLDSGPFFDLVSAGTNARQVVAGPAPTWVATDGRITEAHTRKLEPNERVHAREYAAQFGAEWEHGFFSGLVDPCVAPWASQPYSAGVRYIVSIDPAFARDLSRSPSSTPKSRAWSWSTASRRSLRRAVARVSLRPHAFAACVRCATSTTPRRCSRISTTPRRWPTSHRAKASPSRR